MNRDLARVEAAEAALILEGPKTFAAALSEVQAARAAIELAPQPCARGAAKLSAELRALVEGA